jgi:meso-butanediol dehydrogenase/(S,S)-butanediol dehydrogenase/diacetyl reductase
MQGKVAFVTGGGTGIGAATAIRLAQEGATVVMCGRHQTPRDEVVEKIKVADGQAEAVQADVSDETGFTAAIKAAEQRHAHWHSTWRLGGHPATCCGLTPLR